MMHHLAEMASRVRRAVRTLPQHMDAGEELYIGADGSPTLQIDKVAEDVILGYVNEEHLKWNILSEEAGLIDNSGDRTLVIDPIDGTYNAVMGVPFYSVSLALGTNRLSDIEYGLVQNIVTGDTYQAQRGKGAFMNGSRIRCRKYSAAEGVFLVYMGRYATSEDFQVAQRSRRTRSFGCSSLELALVAQGRADAYYLQTSQQEKSIRVVDIAAAALVLREAGGGLCHMDGRDLDMPFDLRTRHNFLAYGDKSLKEVLL
jgi:fructose-1,6-bisphosphatase/inositol monophosphatase family enzyme